MDCAVYVRAFQRAVGLVTQLVPAGPQVLKIKMAAFLSRQQIDHVISLCLIVAFDR